MSKSKLENAIGLGLVPISLAAVLLPLLNAELPLAALYTSAGFALVAFECTFYLVPLLGPLFVQRQLKGRDRLKVNGPDIPESMGLICASIYMLCLILYIPFLFRDFIRRQGGPELESPLEAALVIGEFPHKQLSIYLAALLSLLSATLLGFLDDVFDIRWRYKLPIPLVASIPLLLVYFAEGGNTDVVLPRFVRSLVGVKILDFGALYYVYMSMLSTFCTNSINILAGINGIETSQALVIAISIALNDLLYLPFPFSFDVSNLHVGGIYGAGMAWGSKEMVDRHLLSLSFMLPLIGVCSAFLWHNWYPARAFPGDTLCYFSGMAFAVVGILGHFSKTLLLFFIPQVFNFLLSCPQLFGLVPCPRHRMPQLDTTKPTSTLLPSGFKLERPPSRLTSIVLEVLGGLRLVRLTRDKSGTIVSGTNLTLLNTLLVVRGPMSEQRLTLECIGLQVLGSALAFFIRYGLKGLFYSLEDDRR